MHGETYCFLTPRSTGSTGRGSCFSLNNCGGELVNARALEQSEIGPMSKKVCRAAIILAATFLSACTADQMYGSAHGWHANQCNKIPDRSDAERCLANAPQTYDSYKRQSAPEAK